jgi:hypothetical protein
VNAIKRLIEDNPAAESREVQIGMEILHHMDEISAENPSATSSPWCQRITELANELIAIHQPGGLEDPALSDGSTHQPTGETSVDHPVQV